MSTPRRHGTTAGTSKTAPRSSKRGATKPVVKAKGKKVAAPRAKGAGAPTKRGTAATPPAAMRIKVFDAIAIRKGPASKAPSPELVSEAAKFVRLQKELLQIAEWRVIGLAAKVNTSQSAIAALLGTSQPTVSRIAKQIELNPRILESSPTEVINRRAVGEIDGDEMMEALLSYSFMPGQYDPTGGDGFIRGDWRQVESALMAGLITDEEYERIARDVPAAKKARVAH
ncbi:MAG: hypothetical protein HQ453_10995 [Actinobacteria bacterium]|nr:hypothetical protein [Actinomycetota bacterium]